MGAAAPSVAPAADSTEVGRGVAFSPADLSALRGGGGYGPPGYPYGAWGYRGGGGGGRGGKYRRPHNRNKENAAPCLNNGGKGGTPA